MNAFHTLLSLVGKGLAFLKSINTKTKKKKNTAQKSDFPYHWTKALPLQLSTLFWKTQLDSKTPLHLYTSVFQKMSSTNYPFRVLVSNKIRLLIVLPTYPKGPGEQKRSLHVRNKMTSLSQNKQHYILKHRKANFKSQQATRQPVCQADFQSCKKQENKL